MIELIKNLEKFGLTQKESKVYLASLELGDSTANDISIKSNLPRTLVYDILERLIGRGLVSYSVKDNKKHFFAVHPKEFLSLLREKETAISSIMGELETIYKKEGIKRPKVEIYEGVEGMKTVMNDIFNSGAGEFLAYGSSRSSYEIIPAFMDDWHKRRIKHKIVMKILYNNTRQAREKVKRINLSLKLTRYKFMPIELESPTATIIYADKIVLQSWTKEPFAVMIKNKEMAENQKKYFNELWKIAKR